MKLTATTQKHVNIYYASLNTGTYGKIIVALDGDAKLDQGSKEGHYTLASTAVNEKQYWIHDQDAIWYNKKRKTWMIGDKKNLGTSRCGLHSTNDTTGPEEATTWKYLKEKGNWKSTSNIFGSPSMY